MKTVAYAVFYFVAVIITAHFFSPAPYDWRHNTISDLAAQGLKYQWIMQAGFIGFGLLINLALIRKMAAAKRLIYPDLLIMLWGAAILLSGVFSTAPFIDGQPVNIQEDRLHTLFAQAAGFALSGAVLLSIFTTNSGREKSFHFVSLLLITAASLLFGLAKNGTLPIGPGLIQRGLWLVSLSWLLVAQYLGANRWPAPSLLTTASTR